MTYVSAHRARAGFTLVELSIVIVIIGLLVGGILAGQSIIRGAEMNAVVSEFRKFQTAMGTFRDKYSALPGDMSTATSVWSAAGQGDGDGKIENTAAAASNEVSQFWIHLSSAGFIEGSFTAAANTALTAGTSIPRSKLNGASWNVAFLGTIAYDGTGTPLSGTYVTGATATDATTFFTGTYENVLMFGPTTGTAVLPASGTGRGTGILKVDEAYNIDNKLDDGKPDTGDIYSLESQGATTGTDRCSDRAGATTALAGASSYKLDSTSGTACSLVFKTGF